MKYSRAGLTVTDDPTVRVFILDKSSGSYVDILRFIVSEACPKSHIPLIEEVFGRDSMLKFLDIFAGMTFKVPPREVLEKHMRDVAIYMTLNKMSPPKRVQAIKALAHRYGTTAGDIRSTFVHVEKLFEARKYKA
jgi:hypothetical protein